MWLSMITLKINGINRDKRVSPHFFYLLLYVLWYIAHTHTSSRYNFSIFKFKYNIGKNLDFSTMGERKDVFNTIIRKKITLGIFKSIKMLRILSEAESHVRTEISA